MNEQRLPSSEDRYHFAAWEELGAGAPTVIAFAALCSQALVAPAAPETPLSLPARTILYLARQRGVLEIRGKYDAFSATARLLSVSVVLDDEQTLALLTPEDPELTVRFLDGFRELCQSGLVMHHLFREFSLTTRGFESARRVTREEVEPLLGRLPAPLES